MLYRTPDPGVNAMLEALFARVTVLLGERMLAMYLDGSLATGGFDQDSDIDFVVITRDRISQALFDELQAMHDALAKTDSVWAIQLEGSYMSQHAVRRYDPADNHYPNLERGAGERLKWYDHDETWDLHRYVLRQRGIPLMGPPAGTFIDPVTPNQLRQVMRSNLTGWAANLLDHPEKMRMRGYQTYIVLSLCRILYTLETAEVVSKRLAAGWAEENLDSQWSALIERAWVGRHGPDGIATAEDIRETQAMIRYALARGEQDQPLCKGGCSPHA